MASEFAHPDVVIGMTILAYRYEGLRWNDFKIVVGHLFEDMLEQYGPYQDRPACKMFARVALAGGRVRRTKRSDLLTTVEDKMSRVFRARVLGDDGDGDGDGDGDDGDDGGDNNDDDDSGVGQAVSDVALGELDPASTIDEVALQLINLRDDDQMGILFQLLRGLPHAIEHYLDTFIVPESCSHQGMKLSACGQELGGDLLFRRRLGFSGTPSDLLPVELGKCQYERGSEGKMLHLLTDAKDVMSAELLGDGWTAVAAASRGAVGTPLALIDTGALVTGMTNLEVAHFLLTEGLDGGGDGDGEEGRRRADVRG